VILVTVICLTSCAEARKKRNDDVRKCMVSLVKCKKDTQNAGTCQENHLKCMQNFDFTKKFVVKEGRNDKFKACFMKLAGCVQGAANNDEIRECADKMETCAVGNAKENPMEILMSMPKPIRKVVVKYTKCKSAAEDNNAHAQCVLSYMAKMKEMQKAMENSQYMKRGNQWRQCFDNLMHCSNVKGRAKRCLAEFKSCQPLPKKGEKQPEMPKEITNKIQSITACTIKMIQSNEDATTMQQYLACVNAVNMPGVPNNKEKLGFCLHNLRNCLVPTSSEDSSCLTSYQSCLGKKKGGRHGGRHGMDGNHMEAMKCIESLRGCKKDSSKTQECTKEHLKCSEVFKFDNEFKFKRRDQSKKEAWRECFSKTVHCHNAAKDEDDYEKCINDFRACSPEDVNEEYKGKPLASKILKCGSEMKKRHGTVPHKDCLNSYIGCVNELQVPGYPSGREKHGFCLRNLQSCSSEHSSCLDSYGTCLGNMHQKRDMRKVKKLMKN